VVVVRAMRSSPENSSPLSHEDTKKNLVAQMYMMAGRCRGGIFFDNKV
jgi:hypothetical protein